MRKMVLILSLFMSFLFSSYAMAQEWYVGGTLHDSNAITWQQASEQNKLATCGDLIGVVWKKNLLNKKISNQIKSINDIEPLAVMLRQELNAAFEKDPNPQKNIQMFSNQDVASNAMLLMITLGWVKM
ncbi:hypothetical protein EKN56_13555 [Limnobaculum zhutongyuii]|uniref:Uncharacterized protein n=1 Tax=Limnobaculum zhutongyuii TaxID=2498113 RepID=A0A411WM92_9GAMM|nr:hypothetical protein [Limnobaculum zhutongyuii]QBH97334.1 hypothetical protein EKN56_13555 [Limnobaculum zhutongyuii]TQS90807.1 hypothetical protein ELQ32_00280 [Limnobaculum zhutongyuii]